MHPIKHFKVITKHRHKVIQHCAKCGILWQGLRHDLSKYSPSEFWRGAKYFQGDKSPNEGERKKHGHSLAWIHHQGRNKHHFEYWKDYSPETRMLSPVKMPYKYVAEMFCDRVAASKIYQGKNYKDSHPIEYFMRAKGKRLIHPDTSDELEILLQMLSDKGEEETFRFIKKRIKGKYTY
ncbi:MAG: catalase [Ruminococcaceae bacterium]|nr:catalase [Oscillospiraceae bacterium]